MLIDKCSFSIHLKLALAHCVIQLLLYYAFSFRKTKNFFVSETGRLSQVRKNEIKSNVNKNMAIYLLCLKKGLSSVDKKMTQKWINEFYITPLERLVKTTRWPKTLKPYLMKKQKAIWNCWKTKYCKVLQVITSCCLILWFFCRQRVLLKSDTYLNLCFINK